MKGDDKQLINMLMNSYCEYVSIYQNEGCLAATTWNNE